MKSNHYLILFLTAAAAQLCHAAAIDPVTVTFQNGANGYSGTFDRRIGPGQAEINGSAITTDTATYYIDGGATALNDDGYTHGLIRFDDITAGIPAGAKILTAKLTVLTKTHGNAQSGGGFNVYRLTRPFDSDSSINTDFGTDGIAGDVDLILGSFDGLTAGSRVSADVTRAVQSWIDGSPNHGLGIRADRTTDGWSFHTTGASNVANRPLLEITYVENPEMLVSAFQQGVDGFTGTTDIILNADPLAATIDGASVAETFIDGVNPPTPEPDIPYMVRFEGAETAIAGRRIERASLRVVTGFSSGAADSPGPFSLHTLHTPFTTSSVYSDFAGVVGAMIAADQAGPSMATVLGANDTEVIDIDVTEAARAWAAGTPNHGLLISAGTANGWQIFTSGAADPDFRPLLTIISVPADPIAITSPAPAGRLTIGAPVNLTADAAASAPATITSVEFFIDGNPAGIDTAAPFSVPFTPSQLGNFTLTATMTDSSGTVFPSEAVAFSVVPTPGSGGLYFNGLADHVTFGDAAELKLTTFTLETWFRRETPGIATTTGAGGVVAIPLIAKGRNQAEGSTLDLNYFLGIREGDGVLVADFEATASGINVPVSGITPITDGTWNHAAATFDGTEWRLYLNGNLEAVQPANGLIPRFDSIQHASLATAINSSGLAEGAFGGFLDEARIWNRSRTQQEIRTSMNAEIPTAAGLVARWNMAEGTGSTLTSTAPPAVQGTLAGPPVWTAGHAFSGNVMPSITITSPPSGTRLTNNAPIILTVDAIDPDGSVTRVEYFDGNDPIGVSNTPPFGLNYPNPPFGTRAISAVVTDNSGASSRTNTATIVQFTFDAPQLPGYALGLIDGADVDVDTGTPAVDPATWAILAGTPAPSGFDNLGTLPGDLPLSIDNTPLPFNSGVVLTTNFAFPENPAAVDNIVAPYSNSGNYRVSSLDNTIPGLPDPETTPESSSFAVGWFPYADGWIGANIDADGSVIEGSSSLPPSVSITPSGTGIYQILGLPNSGNLIVITTGQGSDNIAAASQSGNAWIVQVRDNSQNLESAPLALLYIPETARQALSGRILNDASLEILNDELAALGATTSVSQQGYEITFGDGSLVNPSNTLLFVTPDQAAGNGADNLYSVSANGNSFVVFSHDLPGLSRNFQTGGFRFLATPLNTAEPAGDEVVVTTTTGLATEGAQENQLVFTFTRFGPIDSPLAVAYSLGGTATPGSDFAALPGSVTIPAGSRTATLTVTAIADGLLETDETLSLTLVPGTGYSPGAYPTATGTIRDGGASVPAATVSFQQGVAGYSGQFDKRIGSDGTNQLGSAVASYFLDGVPNNASPDINGLIRFDGLFGANPGQIPAGASILTAELVLTTSTAGDAQTGGPYIIDRLTLPVDASTTYLSLDQGSGFEGVRGASTGLPLSAYGTIANGQVATADVTAIVRDWANGEPNHGFAVYSGGTTDGWSISTSGNSTAAARPKLVVTYSTEPTREITLTADQSSLVNSQFGGSATDGSTLEAEFLDTATNNTQEAMMRFPVTFGGGGIPLDEEIVKAELLITTGGALFGGSANAHSPGPGSIHRVLTAWDTTTTFGTFGPQVGNQIAPPSATFSGMGQGSTLWIDVTSIVRSWRAGEPNYGFNIKLATTDDWQMFWPGTINQFAQPRLRITTSGGTAPESGFSQWSSANGAPGIEITSDHDNDGISALVEYALGLSPTAPDTLPALVRTGNSVSLTFQKGAEAAADPSILYTIESSTDLGKWDPTTPSTSNASVISITQPIDDPRRFFRLLIEVKP